MNLLMFDIDGTLIHSHEDEVTCFELAINKVLGISGIDKNLHSYPHVSDSGILKECIYRALNRYPSAQEIEAVESVYLAHFTEKLAINPIQPIQGAASFIEILQARSDVALAVATGSHQRAAKLKLSHVAPSLCEVPIATSTDSHVRTTIMQTALDAAKRTYERESFDRIIYIGDGIWDIEAVKVLQWGFIGVASQHSRQQLQAFGAKCVIDDYLTQSEFLAFLKSEELYLS